MAYLRVLDESNPVQDYCVAMDFQGAGVTVTRPSNNDSIVVTIPSAAAVAGWTDDGAIVRLTTATDSVAIGTAALVGTEKVRILNAAGVGLRMEGRLDLAKAGTAAAAASQARSYVARFTASMWTGGGVPAEAERDFDWHATPSSLVADENAGALANLSLDYEGTRILDISPVSAGGAFANIVFKNPAADSAAPVFEFWATTDIGAANPVFRISDAPGEVNLFEVLGAGQVRIVSGAAATPALVFATDPTTGLFSPVAGTLGFAVSGVQYLRIIAGSGIYGDTPIIAATGLQSDTWTSFTGVASPGALAAGTTQDYAPAGIATISALRLTPDGGGTSALGGITAGTAGRILTLFNLGAVNLTLNHQDGGSGAVNRFTLPGAAAHIIGAGEAAMLWYDLTSTSWRLMAQS